MEDFRVGSVPSPEPYGHRQPYGSVARRRQRHHDGEDGQPPDEDADSFEAAGDDSASAGGETVEDYYLPSDPSGGEE
jgi:hypothetical protein